MNALHAQRNFAAAMRLMTRATVSAAALPSLDAVRTTAELVQRARVVRSALNARSLFRDVYARAAALSEALSRFQERKQVRRECRPSSTP